jgi:hypothetical protein
MLGTVRSVKCLSPVQGIIEQSTPVATTATPTTLLAGRLGGRSRLLMRVESRETSSYAHLTGAPVAFKATPVEAGFLGAGAERLVRSCRN